jgi:DNA-binding NarL/FixJ family response regulator
MLSMHNDHSMISRMMELGANSYLTKESDSETIYQAVITCYAEEFFFNDLTNKALLNRLRMKQEAPATEEFDANLNDKEKLVLKLICEEHSTREIAEMVEISPRTVEAIRDKLKVKTGSKSMAGLVMYAVKAGIVAQA